MEVFLLFLNSEANLIFVRFAYLSSAYPIPKQSASFFAKTQAETEVKPYGKSKEAESIPDWDSEDNECRFNCRFELQL